MKLKAAKFGNGLKEIGDQAFYGCKRLESLTIGKGVIRIGQEAFCKCKALKKITIPAKTAFINYKAFYGCSKLKSITVKTIKLKTMNVGSKAFAKTPVNIKVKVPNKVYRRYRKLLQKKESIEMPCFIIYNFRYYISGDLKVA